MSEMADPRATLAAATALLQRVCDMLRTADEDCVRAAAASVLRDSSVARMFEAAGIRDERGIVAQLAVFLSRRDARFIPPSIPLTESDTTVFEMPLRYGRADAVIFHLDGTATVIEVKHGGAGIRSVLGGIGQASMYAAQLGQTKGALREVRRALAWNPLRVASEDDLVVQACEASGVIPIKLLDPEKIRASIAKMIGEQADDRLGRLLDVIEPAAADISQMLGKIHVARG